MSDNKDTKDEIKSTISNFFNRSKKFLEETSPQFIERVEKATLNTIDKTSESIGKINDLEVKALQGVKSILDNYRSRNNSQEDSSIYTQQGKPQDNNSSTDANQAKNTQNTINEEEALKGVDIEPKNVVDKVKSRRVAKKSASARKVAKTATKSAKKTTKKATKKTATKKAASKKTSSKSPSP